MKAGPSHTEMRELSEIIVEINDLRELALDPDRPEQNRWRFNFSPLAAHPISKYQRSRAPKRFNGRYNTILIWEHNNFSNVSGSSLFSMDCECPGGARR